jgi:hypothetical protein
VLSVGTDGCARWQDTSTGEWHHYIGIATEHLMTNTFPDSPVQAVPNRERLAEIKALALQYHATLTKTGTVRKTSKANL